MPVDTACDEAPSDAEPRDRKRQLRAKGREFVRHRGATWDGWAGRRLWESRPNCRYIRHEKVVSGSGGSNGDTDSEV